MPRTSREMSIWMREESKGAPVGTYGFSYGGGPTFADAFNYRRAPTPYALTEAYKSLIFTLVRINFDAVARVPLRLVRISDTKGDRAKYCDARPVSRATKARLSGLSHTSKAMAAAEETEEITGDHPLLKMVQDVNPEMDIHQHLAYTVMSMDVVGSAFWWPTEYSLGCPREVWALPPQLVYPITTSGTMIPDAYQFGSARYEKDELIRFKHLSMRNPYGMGMSPTQAAIEYARLEDSWVSISENMLTNGPRPDVIVSLKDGKSGMGTAERTRFENDLNRKGRGGRTGGAFVVDAAVTMTPMSYSPSDLGGLEISKYDMERMCGCFGVPVSMVTNESSNRAVAEAGLIQHGRGAVEPRCKAIASALTRWTRALDKNGKRNWRLLHWVFDDCVPEDKQAQADLHVKYFGFGLPPNRILTEAGYDPIEGGDISLVPSGLVTLDSIVNPPEPQPVPDALAQGQDPAAVDGQAVEEPDPNEVPPEPDAFTPDAEAVKMLAAATFVVLEAERHTGMDWEELLADDADLDPRTKAMAALTAKVIDDVTIQTGYEWDAESKGFKARPKPCHDNLGHFAPCGAAGGGSRLHGPTGPPKKPGAGKPKPGARKPAGAAGGKKPPKAPAKPAAKPGGKPAAPAGSPKPAAAPSAAKPAEKPAKPPANKPAEPANTPKPAKPEAAKPAAAKPTTEASRPVTHFGESKAKIVKDPDYTPAEHAAIVIKAKSIIGPHATDADIASIVGAPHDAKVSIRQGQIPDMAGDKSLTVYFKGPGYGATRVIKRGADGQLTIKNVEINVKDTGKGLGSKIFGAQVEQAVRLGASKIDCTAARSDTYNGYITWPKLGYDGAIPDGIKAKLPRGPLKKAKSVQDLMKTPEGTDWWQKNGTSTPMTFDLKAGSKSRAHLAKYLEKKGLTK